MDYRLHHMPPARYRRSPPQHMQRAILTALVVGAMAFPVTAQDQTPVFSTNTTLIEFTVTAIDKRGNPVTDLKKEEIVVKDKGQPRDLALFRYEGGEQSRVVPELPPGVFTNTPGLTPGPPRNVTALVLDTLNTQPKDQAWVKAQAMRYLQQLLPDTRLAVYILGHNLTVLHDFTDDPESLRARIEEARVKQAGPTFGQVDDIGRDLESMIQRITATAIKANQMDPLLAPMLAVERRAHESADDQRIRKTLGLLEALGDHLAGIPGRKSIVWFGSGVSMLSIVGSLEFDTPGSDRSYEDLVESTSRRLAQQGITMYMFDARGMQMQAEVSAERQWTEASSRGLIDPFEREKANAAISADMTPAMAMFADITGGRFYWNTNDVGRAMDEIAADSQGTYSVGFYADSEPDDKWHNLNVRITRKGVKLQHPDGYLSAEPPSAPLDWTEDQWQAAVINPIASTAIRIDAQLKYDDSNKMSLLLQIVADDLHFRQLDGQSSAAVDVAIVGKLPDARFQMQRAPMEIPAPTGESAQRGVVQVAHNWEPTPGATTVRLILLDRLTGRYGSLDVPVKDIPVTESAPTPSVTPQ